MGVFDFLRFKKSLPEFEPNKTYGTHFPWEDVEPCLKKRLVAEKFINKKPCPVCQLSSENLSWVKFSSPSWTWQNLSGREGPLSICPKCKIQVEFIIEVRN